MKRDVDTAGRTRVEGRGLAVPPDQLLQAIERCDRSAPLMAIAVLNRGDIPLVVSPADAIQLGAAILYASLEVVARPAPDDSPSALATSFPVAFEDHPALKDPGYTFTAPHVWICPAAARPSLAPAEGARSPLDGCSIAAVVALGILVGFAVIGLIAITRWLA